MKYPSLKSVNLVVVDGRFEDANLPIYMSGCLLALANRFDGHVLILCSTTDQVEQVESLGEELGLDFFFHGDQASDSVEFLNYCENAQMIIEPSREINNDREWKHLHRLGKTVLLPQSVASTVEIWPEVIVLNDEEIAPARIMEIILA
jgi:hypothetical protein